MHNSKTQVDKNEKKNSGCKLPDAQICKIPTICLLVIRISLLTAMMVVSMIVIFTDTFSLHSLQVILALQLISTIVLLLCAWGAHQESDLAVMLCWMSVTCNHISEYMSKRWQIITLAFELVACILVTFSVLHTIKALCSNTTKKDN